MNLGGNLFLDQQLALSMNQIQSLEILALDTIELKDLLKNEYLENPMFDCKNAEGTDSSVQTVTYDRSYSDVVDDNDRRMADIPMPEEGQIRKFLMEQLSGMDADTEYVADYLIDCLDETGFFTMPVEEVAAGCGRPAHKVQEVLQMLQQLEPYGIFAPDLQHCLMKQLEIQSRQDSDVYQVLNLYFEDLLAGKISTITRAMKLSTARVRECLEEMAKLNPRPMQGFRTGENHYIEPDVIAQKTDDGWTVELNDGWVENYSINDYYLSMMQQTDDEELKAYFQKKLERARMLLSSIVQRRRTVIRISLTIIERQKDFFEQGGYLKPMTMTDLADELAISPSTVSRAVRSKYLQYPGGMILMKDLFTQRASKNADGDMTADAVRTRIKEMIDAEDKSHPLSDQTLADMLKAEGTKVSRRAVAKYRDELGIKGSFDRKM